MTAPLPPTTASDAEMSAEWRAAMEGVTPGDWRSSGRYVGTPNHLSLIGECRDQNGNWTDEPHARRHAAWIARCSPSGIASLLDRLGQLSAEVAAKDAEKAKLADPVAVHLNMLRGTIAKPSIQNVAHLYPEVQQMRQALIATLKHFRHPTSAEHETRDKVMAALSHFDEPPLTPMFQALSPRMEADNAG